MTPFVLDASMTLAWHFENETTSTTMAVERMTLEEAVVVPAHWFAEVANILLVGERRRRTTLSDTLRFLERLTDLAIVVDDLGKQDLFDRILPLARAHGLTVYDTLYLELAEREGLPLASLDKDLCDAARRVGVTVVTDSL